MTFRNFFRKLIQPHIRYEKDWNKYEKEEAQLQDSYNQERTRQLKNIDKWNLTADEWGALLIEEARKSPMGGWDSRIAKLIEEMKAREEAMPQSPREFADEFVEREDIKEVLWGEESPVDKPVDDVDNDSPKNEGETGRDEFTLGDAWNNLNNVNQAARHEMEELNHQRKQIEEQQAKLASEANTIDKKLEYLSHFRSRIEPIAIELENHINNGASDGPRRDSTGAYIRVDERR